MRHPVFFPAVLSMLSLLALSAPAADQVTQDQAERIKKAAPEKARFTPTKPRRVLIFSTPAPLLDKDPHRGYSVPQGECAMKVLGEKTGAFEPITSDDLAMFLPENLRKFDAIVMNNSCGPWITPTDQAMEKLKSHGADKEAVEKLLRKSLLDYVSSGGGIVACHYAIGANGHWPEFREMLGATFSGHPWNEEVGVKLDEPGHPLLGTFGGKGLRIADEIYQFREPYSRKNVRVLMSVDTKTTNMKVKWIERKDDDFAQAWVRPYGKGRVFYCGFGHRTEIWWNPAVLKFYLDAIQFAAGDLEAPTAPK
jgi:type 1 glutamine amidotransferase